jgi:hypothetical protein
MKITIILLFHLVLKITAAEELRLNELLFNVYSFYNIDEEANVRFVKFTQNNVEICFEKTKDLKTNILEKTKTYDNIGTLTSTSYDNVRHITFKTIGVKQLSIEIVFLKKIKKKSISLITELPDKAIWMRILHRAENENKFRYVLSGAITILQTVIKIGSPPETRTSRFNDDSSSSSSSTIFELPDKVISDGGQGTDKYKDNNYYRYGNDETEYESVIEEHSLASDQQESIIKLFNIKKAQPYEYEFTMDQEGVYLEMISKLNGKVVKATKVKNNFYVRVLNIRELNKS